MTKKAEHGLRISVRRFVPFFRGLLLARVAPVVVGR